ncbi:hypothetical protein FQN51_001465 [Onygenales sp. PD_10]|nr:hypothetical protein FQN51_001465 [Onygenales sp. PD_10]
MRRRRLATWIAIAWVGVLGGRAEARIIGSREPRHGKLSQRSVDLQPDSDLHARSPNGHVAGAVVVIEAHAGAGAKAMATPLLLPNTIPFASDPDPAAAVESIIVSIANSPSGAQQAVATAPGASPAQASALAPEQSAALSPIAISNGSAVAAQPGIAADACACHCLCPFDAFGIPAVNLATTYNLGPPPMPSPTTLATVASPSSVLAQSPNVGVTPDAAATTPPLSVDGMTTIAASVGNTAGTATPVIDGVIETGAPSSVALGDSAVTPSATNAAGAPAEGQADLTEGLPLAGETAAPGSVAPSTSAITPAATTAAAAPAEGQADLTESLPPAGAMPTAGVAAGPAQAPSDADLTESPVAPETTAAAETTGATNPAAGPVDISTMALFSALTIRLGG